MDTKNHPARVLLAAISFFIFSTMTGLAAADNLVPRDTATSSSSQTFDFGHVPAYSGGAFDAGAVSVPSGPVVIRRDLSALPGPVMRLRNEIIAAARSGDIARLGPIFARQAQPTQLGQDQGADPVVALRNSSNDGDGRETLAIMLDLFDAPFAVYNEGKSDAVYVWPAFVAEDLNKLTPEDLVDVYRIVSSQDLTDMQNYGGWFFYRIGISAKGQWLYFSAGD